MLYFYCLCEIHAYVDLRQNDINSSMTRKDNIKKKNKLCLFDQIM